MILPPRRQDRTPERNKERIEGRKVSPDMVSDEKIGLFVTISYQMFIGWRNTLISLNKASLHNETPVVPNVTIEGAARLKEALLEMYHHTDDHQRIMLMRGLYSMTAIFRMVNNRMWEWFVLPDDVAVVCQEISLIEARLAELKQIAKRYGVDNPCEKK